MRIVLTIIFLSILVGCSSKYPDELVGKWERETNRFDDYGLIFYEDGSAEIFRCLELWDNKAFKGDFVYDSIKTKYGNDDFRILRENLKFRTIGRKDSLTIILDFYKSNQSRPFYSFPLGIIRIQSENEFWLYQNRWNRSILLDGEIFKILDYHDWLEDAFTECEKSLTSHFEDHKKTKMQIRKKIDTYDIESSLEIKGLNDYEKTILNEINKPVYRMDKTYKNEIFSAKSFSFEKLFLAIDEYNGSQRRVLDIIGEEIGLTYSGIGTLGVILLRESEYKKLNLIKMSYDISGENLDYIKKYLSGVATNGLQEATNRFHHDSNNLNFLIFGQGRSPGYKIFRKGI